MVDSDAVGPPRAHSRRSGATNAEFEGFRLRWQTPEVPGYRCTCASVFVPTDLLRWSPLEVVAGPVQGRIIETADGAARDLFVRRVVERKT